MYKKVVSAFLRIAACSYEGSLFGWNIEEDCESDELRSSLLYAFNDGGSDSALKAICCSASGKYLASGGTNERVRIFNLLERKSVGDLINHTGAITTLGFHRDAHLFSGSQDGTICIWRVYDWQCIHILGGHKGPVHDFSVHPSGMLGLSVSKDCTLKVWNLVQGRCAFTRRLKKPADQVLWHPSGEFYLISGATEVQLFKASDNGLVTTLVHSSRVNRADFSSFSVDTTAGNIVGTTASSPLDRIVTVCDDCSLNMFGLDGKMIARVDLTPLHGGRPRDLCCLKPNAAAIQNQHMQELICRPLTVGGENMPAAATAAPSLMSTGKNRKKSSGKAKKDTGTENKGETSAIHTGGAAAAPKLVDNCLVVGTSSGLMVVLSHSAVEALGFKESGGNVAAPAEANAAASAQAHISDTTNGGGGGGGGDGVESAVLVLHHLPAEPRLTAITAWTDTSEAPSEEPYAKVAVRASQQQQQGQGNVNEEASAPARTKKRTNKDLVVEDGDIIGLTRRVAFQDGGAAHAAAAAAGGSNAERGKRPRLDSSAHTSTITANTKFAKLPKATVRVDLSEDSRLERPSAAGERKKKEQELSEAKHTKQAKQKKQHKTRKEQ